MEKKEQKKLKNLPSRFFVELQGISLETVPDKQRLGLSLLTLAEKFGVNIPKTRNNREGISNHVMSLGIVKSNLVGYQLSPDWRTKVQDLFQRESIDFTIEKKEVEEKEEAVKEEEEVVAEQQFTTPTTMREFYRGFLSTTWCEGLGKKEILKTLFDYTVKCTGIEPTDGWVKQRFTYLSTSLLAVEETGSIIEDNWEAILNKRNVLGRKLVVTPKTATQQPPVEEKAIAPVVEPEEVEEEVSIIKAIVKIADSEKFKGAESLMKFSNGTEIIKFPFSKENENTLIGLSTLAMVDIDDLNVVRSSLQQRIDNLKGELEKCQAYMM